MYKIKPLNWQKSATEWFAYAFGNCYTVRASEITGTIYMRYTILDHAVLTTKANSIEHGRELAENHYEDMMKSHLIRAAGA